MIPYKNEDEFVRGQKRKLWAIVVLLAVASIAHGLRTGVWWPWS